MYNKSTLKVYLSTLKVNIFTLIFNISDYEQYT